MLAHRFLTGVALLAVVAAGSGASAETLVLVSPPPELAAAVRASLAPWRVKIIVVELAAGTPAELALGQGAGFVVWRDDDQLVLWDAGTGTGARRDVPPDLDDAGAAALALSIKTWMHLGSPPVPPAIDVPPEAVIDGQPPERAAVGTVVAPTPLAPPRLRLEAASGARANAGDQGRTGFRATVGIVARTGPIDVAVTAELGPALPAGDAAATGDLGTIAVAAHGRWPVPVSAAVVVAPTVGLVVLRSSFRGLDGMDRSFAASGSGLGVDAAGVVEWRRGWLVVAVEVGATVVPLSQELQDRNIKLVTDAHIEPRGLLRIGWVLR